MKKVDYIVGFSTRETVEKLKSHFGNKCPDGTEFFEVEDGKLLIRAPGFDDLIVPEGQWGEYSLVVELVVTLI